MPDHKQGDILQMARDDKFDFAVVFGHCGFTLMAACWGEFSDSIPGSSTVQDPFRELANGPYEIAEGSWISFIRSRANHGMTDAEVINALETSLKWAHQEGHVRVITNGIMDIDKDTDIVANNASHDRRAQLINQLATQYETEFGMEITLTSLNDVFRRNAS